MSPRLLALEGLQNVEQIRPVLQRLCPTKVPGFGKIILDRRFRFEYTLDILHYSITVWQITITIVDNN